MISPGATPIDGPLVDSVRSSSGTLIGKLFKLICRATGPA
jgi:hypothetical protein